MPRTAPHEGCPTVTVGRQDAHPCVAAAECGVFAQPSDARGLLQLAAHLLLLCGTGVCVWSLAEATSWLGWLAASAAHGCVLAHLYMPLHESTHYTAFRSHWLCDAVAWACGAATTFNATFFRHFHKQHHIATQEVGADPELPGASASLVNYAHKLLGGEMLVALRGLVLTGWGGCDSVLPIPWVPAAEARALVFSVRAQLALYAGVALGACANAAWRRAVLQLWLLPLALGQPPLWAHFISQHTGTALGTADARRNSRVVLASAPYHFLTWNMGYHAVHHMNPRIPFHQLPRAFRELHAQKPFAHVARSGAHVHAALLAGLGEGAGAVGGAGGAKRRLQKGG